MPDSVKFPLQPSPSDFFVAPPDEAHPIQGFSSALQTLVRPGKREPRESTDQNRP